MRSSEYASSAQNVIDSYQLQWDQAIANKVFLPFIFPYSVSNWGLLILYLLYSRTELVQKSTYAVFAAIVWLSITTMAHCRTLSLNYGTLIGVTSSWCVVSSAAFMLFHTPHKGFCRLVKTAPYKHQPNPPDSPEGEDCMKKPKGTPSPPTYENVPPNLVWEYMPRPFWKRLLWILDLVTSLRGLHWSWRSQNIPSVHQFHAHPTQRRPLRAALQIILIYLSLDSLNVIAKTDPYFWGTISPTETGLSLSHNYHVAITFLILLVVNLAVFNIPPLLCVHILGPNIVGKLGEPWMYVTAPGPMEAILKDGLQGFWSSWWHQMFRFGFSSPGIWLVDRLGIARSRPTARVLRIFVAFALSGFVHACGCYTQWPATSSLKLFMSFVLQPVGILLQGMITLALGERSRFDRVVKPCFMVFWLWLTCGSAGDEYAKGGMWLVEPLPFSPLRSLGLGPAPQRWWLWHGPNFHVYRGDHWWQSGLAI